MNYVHARRAGWMALAMFGLLSGPPSAAAATAEESEFFEKKVRPLLIDNCFRCHSAGKKQKGNLLLDSRAGMLEGGDTGPAIVPGRPDRSLLLKAIGYQDAQLRMPPKSKLPPEHIATLTAWIKMGAPWPQATVNPKATVSKGFDLEERRKHWALQPLRKTALPTVRQRAWPRSPMDHYILAGLEARGLAPAKDADSRTLIRRLTYDLIGLPPTPAEIDAFLADRSPAAYEKLVDRLLASPNYGERWGRHWLDLVRYGETYGHEFDFDIPDAQAYRDYVIRAFNGNVPYDQLVLEHIAGDLLPRPRRHFPERFNESIIGTGFYFLGESRHSPVDVRADGADRADNQIDVLTKTFLGLTVSCARCHDHKFDAISTRDYYALAGYLRSSRMQRAFYEDPDNGRQLVGRLRDLHAQARALAIPITAENRKEQVRHLAQHLLKARAAAQPQKGSKEAAAHLDAWLKVYRQINRNQADHLFHPWLVLADAKPQEFTARRQALVKRYQDMMAKADHRGQAILFEDFKKKTYQDWFVTGEAFGEGPNQAGDVLLQPDVRKPVRHVLGPGLAHSGRVSGKLHGVLRSRTFTIAKKKIWYHIGGSGVKVNLIIDGYQLIRYPIYGGLTFSVNSGDRLHWHAMDVSMWIGHRAYVEIIDEGTGHAAVERIVFSDEGPSPPKPNPLLVRLLVDPALDSPEALARKYQELFLEILNQWRTGRLEAATDREARIALLNVLLQEPVLDALPASDAGRPSADAAKLLGLLQQYQRLEAGLAEPRHVMAMADGTGENEHVFIRGNHKSLGPEAPRRFLEAITGKDQPRPVEGSGRLELARRMIDSSNPLLPRVMVNRIWQHHFGEGLVRSVDNFGVLGELPTHPELLDLLAAEFARQGWSIKKMHRMMVLSRTYQMASRADAQAEKLDPQNKLLHRMPLRRLEAECIRDAILAVSGRLDRKQFGPSVLPFVTDFMIGRGRPPSGPLDGAGRRSIYIAVRRNFLTPMFLAFDYPIPFTTIGKRSVSNVPAQALTLMNNPFVLQQAATWARRVLAEPNRTPEQRIMGMYLTAFGRPPAGNEMSEALAFLTEQGKQYGQADDPRAWSDLCHVLLNVKEFIFID